MTAIDVVLFDRDGTLVEDVPYNGDPDLVRPVPDAAQALALLRARGIGTGVVTNQSGIARGLLSTADVRRVNERLDGLLGPFDTCVVCPHGPDDACGCRKPEPGMILTAADRLRTPPERVAVIGDIGADVQAARRAGALGVLVPNEQTLPEEIAAAEHVAPDLVSAVRVVLAWKPSHERVLTDEPAAHVDTGKRREVPDSSWNTAGRTR